MVTACAAKVVTAVTLAVVLVEPAFAQTSDSPPSDSLEATGVFAPAGPPTGAPSRVDAGGACVVDVQQSYDVEGTLEGTFEIDFRILVHGPCGSAPGTFDEEWIALGRFAGAIRGERVSSGFTYTAEVRNGGEIHGVIRFGPEMAGELEVIGQFQSGRLTYGGWTQR